MLGALAEGLAPLGVRVSAASTSVERERVVEGAPGGDRSQFTSTAESVVRADFGEVEVRDFKVDYCQPAQGPESVRARVTMSVAEWERVKRVKRGKTLLVVRCRSDAPGVCDDVVAQGARQAAQGAGLAVAAVVQAPEGLSAQDADAVLGLGVKHAALHVMVVELRVRAVGQTGEGEAATFFASTEAFAAVVETSNGKTLATWKPQGGRSRPFKAGQYAQHGGAEAAQRRSLKFALHGDGRGQEGLVDGARRWGLGGGGSK